MPLYEYHCKSCGTDFEKMVRMSETDRSPACPICQSQDTHKKISTFASRITGGGAAVSSGSSCGSSGRFS